MNRFGIWSVLVLVLIGVLALSAYAESLPVTLDNVQIDGTTVTPGDTNKLDLERGQTVDVRIEMSASADVSNLEVTGFISGYEYNDINRMSDTTHIFDMTPGITYVKTLTLTVPSNVDSDYYLLRVIATDRNGETLVYDFKLWIDVARHSVQITDVVFNPEQSVVAGQALLSTVRIKNAGEMDEDSVKVTVAIPTLGVSASDYIDTIASGDSTTSEELYMRIPADTKAGDYEADVTVKYDEGYTSTTAKEMIHVTEPVCASDACKPAAEKADKTVISVSSDSQNLKKGEGGSVYPIALTNQGSATKTYVISVDGTEGWATTRLSPSNVVVLAPGDTATVFVYVSATEDATPGDHMFSVTISSADNVLKQLPLKASVAGNTPAATLGWDKIKTALEIGFVILVVILVVLGLIIGFSKLREKEEPEQVSGQTYY